MVDLDDSHIVTDDLEVISQLMDRVVYRVFMERVMELLVIYRLMADSRQVCTNLEKID